MPQKTIFIRGMHCKSCEIVIEDNLKKIPGIERVKISHRTGRADLTWTNSEPSAEDLRAAVESAGYGLGEPGKDSWLSKDFEVYSDIMIAAVILSALCALAYFTGLSGFNFQPVGGAWWLPILVGLAAGFSSCMALVGGLVLGISARHSELHPEKTALQKFYPHLLFNSGRILGFSFLGGLIGLVGSVLSPSVFWTGILSMIAGSIMIFLGLKLVGISPILRNSSFTLPKGLSRFLGLRNDPGEYSHKASFLSGILTFFLPCGFTQAMQILAISSGSFSRGSVIMGLFAMGTAPGLLSIGWLSSVFRGRAGKIFFAAAGLAIIFLGSYNLNNASRIVFSARFSGSNRPLIEALPDSSGPSVSVSGSASTGEFTSDNAGSDANAVQEVRMTQGAGGYSPNQFAVKVGIPVKWIITSENQYTCAAYINMPAYGISQPLRAGENVIRFTPTRTGDIQFSCSMGMYRGKFTVTGDR